jgi:predicted DNA-binding transcriptional regulator YafY
MKKTERLLYIVSVLRTNRRLRACDLARRCEVTERTIYRDIISISEANIPIYYDGGYKLLHKGFLPPGNLSPHEAGFLLSLLQSPLFSSGKLFHETIRRISDKIKSEEISSPEMAAINIGAISTERPGNQRHVPKLEDAIRNHRMVKIGYISLKGQRTKRKIDPYAICFRRHAWYLVGFCHLRNEVRTFRLGRVHSIGILPEKFEISGNFSVEKYFSGSLGVYSGNPTRFRVRFTGQSAVAIKTSQHHPDEIIVENSDGSVNYEITVAGNDEFLRWIMGFGAEAEILEPERARRELAKALGAMLKIYDLGQTQS